LLPDNAHSPSAVATVQASRKLKFELLPHPPYSLYIAQSDYCMSGPLGDALRGLRFASHDEVKDAAHTWLRSQPKVSWRMESAGL
jgi:hypothetical protein